MGPNLKVITSKNRLVYIVRLIFIPPPPVPKNKDTERVKYCLKAPQMEKQMNYGIFSEPHSLGDMTIRLMSFELIITAKKSC